MSWNPPLTTKIDLDSRRRAEFFFGYELSSGLKNGRAQFEVRPSFNISYLNKASWEEVHADISTIELFFGFISRDRGGAPDVGLESSLSRRQYHTKEGKRKRYYHQPHEVMLSGGNYSKKSYENGRRPAPIIRFDASEYDFGNMMRSWFAHRFVFERAAKLLWMSKQDGVGVESRLIFLSQALEFLHRETIGGELIDNEDFVALKAGLGALIAASIGKEKGNVIVQRLEYLNEPGLRKRLKDIFRAVQKPTLFVKDYKSISSAVAEYRNIFTHHLHIGKSSDVWVQEVADLSDVLEGLLELYMCRRLGLDDRKINAIIQEDCNFYRSFRGGNYNVRR